MFSMSCFYKQIKKGHWQIGKAKNFANPVIITKLLRTGFCCSPDCWRYCQGWLAVGSAWYSGSDPPSPCPASSWGESLRGEVRAWVRVSLQRCQRQQPDTWSAGTRQRRKINKSFAESSLKQGNSIINKWLGRWGATLLSRFQALPRKAGK